MKSKYNILIYDDKVVLYTNQIRFLERLLIALAMFFKRKIIWKNPIIKPSKYVDGYTNPCQDEVRRKF